MSAPLRSVTCLALALAACSPDVPATDRSTSDAGEPAGAVSPEEQQASTSERVPAPRVTQLVERATIGLMEHGPEDYFGQIRAIAVDRLGRLYVADTYTTDVRVFDSAGAYVRTLGRKGQGPGEFTWPEGLTWQNDSTLWVLDAGANYRYSAYDTSGVHIRDRRRFALLGSLAPWLARFDGEKLIEPWIRSGEDLLAAVDPDASFDAPEDTFPYPLAGVPLDEWNPTVYVRSGTTVRGMKVPFTEGIEWSLDGRGGVWIGDTRSGRLVRRSLAGDTLLIVTHDVPGARVSAEERRAAIDSLGPDASALDLSRIPDRKPVFRIIVSSDDGGVWLVREGEGPTWFVDTLDAEGRRTASAELPVEPDLKVLPVVRGSDLWLATRGAMDVQFVVRFSMR
jgi:hypothetical protein